jgi:flagellar biosynthesis protein FlhF
MESEAQVSRLLRQQLEAMLQVDPQLGSPGASRRVIALVGPPGAGKTCTLVKLAVAYGLQTRRPSIIISTDAYRIGATEQLRAYAATIGMAFQAVDSSVALGQALEEHRSKELVLIDSPGYGLADIDAGADFARFLSLHPDVQVHLVMPATMRSDDVARTAERFSIFGASRLIVTKIDETAAHGAVISQSILSGLPISFLCGGQQIPDDIEPACKDKLLGFLRREEFGLAASAA